MRPSPASGRREESEDSCDGSAIDHEAGAGDETARFAGQKEGRAGEFLGRSPAAQGGTGSEGVLLFLAEDGHGHVGGDGAGGQAVDSNAEGSEV